MIAASDNCPVIFSLSAGNAGDAPEGRKLLERLGAAPNECNLVMDRAYEGNETQSLSRGLGYTPVVPPNPRRRKPWNYDKVLYKKRNEVERLFRRLKGYRRIATRYDKLDVIFAGFIIFALIVEVLRL